MADRQELERAAARDLPGRDARKLSSAVNIIMPELDPQEQVLKVATGTWFNDKKCLLIATSRRIVATDGERVDAIPYDRVLSVDYSEGWRKARLNIRGQGAAADVRDVHLDTARELRTMIETARRAPGARPPA